MFVSERGGPISLTFHLDHPVGANQCTSMRREQARRGHRVSFAGTIEIVSMLVVAQEYRVDLSDLICVRAGPVSFFSVTCGSLYSPGASNVRSVSKRKPFASMSVVGPPIRVMTGALMITPADAAPRTGAATSDPRPKTEQHGRLLEP